MNNVIEVVGWTLVDFAWQGAVIGVITALLLLTMRGAGPRQRYLVACAGLLACMAWPALQLMARLADGPATAASVRSMMAAGGGIATSTAGLAGLVQDHLPAIVGAWALCALLMAGRMLLGLAWIGRAGNEDSQAHPELQRRLDALAERFGIGRAVRVRVLANIQSPITAGWLKPIIMIPASLATRMPTDLLEALLAHELAHVKRMDYVVNLVQHLVETVLFYHPAVWWISRQVRAEREKIADDLAARHLGEPRRLARALSELEKMQFSGRNLALGADGGDLVDRIARLVRPQQRPAAWNALLPLILVATLGAAPLLQASVANPAAGTPSASSAQGKRDASRVTGDRQAVVDFASCSKPNYPHESLAKLETGTVTLAFDITVTGDVGSATVKKSSGHPLLDEAARSAIALCKFKPALKRGRAIASTTYVQYVWTLD
ncbi:M56 family peptidase [Massilia arenosa]|uniref:M56 family peptidase n=2 Tax=Zemynaea arenosa TaxID=2561931 RepID=A0A4Y9SNT7_9BURK|nr:M56 family peptidase [Massilia arenosa]